MPLRLLVQLILSRQHKGSHQQAEYSEVNHQATRKVVPATCLRPGLLFDNIARRQEPAADSFFRLPYRTLHPRFKRGRQHGVTTGKRILLNSLSFPAGFSCPQFLDILPTPHLLDTLDNLRTRGTDRPRQF